MEKKSLAHLRKDYERATLDESSCVANPFEQFGSWMDQALDAQIPEATAMTVATVGSDLRPSTRIVLLKSFDASGFVWFSNYHSRKGKELSGNPFCALQFHWVELERVVRIEGVVVCIDVADSDAYFYSRPLPSRIGAWASPQSEVIESRGILMARAAKYGAQYLLNPPRPPHWGGYRLIPDRFEFWQGRESRLHDRMVYTRSSRPNEEGAAMWTLCRLAP